jgi:hypothetical protein
MSEVDIGVLSLTEVEQAVIRGYLDSRQWPHKCVSLFILKDLQPLIRQLRPGTDLPPGDGPAIESRPMVNVYDLADLRACHVFVNHWVMEKEGYWADTEMMRALLAHEHAHPIAENRTTRLSRSLRLQLSGGSDGEPAFSGDHQAQLLGVVNSLAEKLCLYAPREIFANQVTIQSGFGQALLQLDRRNLSNAVRGVAGRQDLCDHLQQQVRAGQFTSGVADSFLLVGDLQGYLELALEIIPFYRAGQEKMARELEDLLETAILPHLDPQASWAYTELRSHYLALETDLGREELLLWGQGVLGSLANALAERGLILNHKLELIEEHYA